MSFYIIENCKYIIARDRACHCGKPARFIAHRLAKSKMNLKKYGESIVHHKYNLRGVCDNPNCNDKMNIGFNPGAVQRLLFLIEHEKKAMSGQEIDEYLRS